MDRVKDWVADYWKPAVVVLLVCAFVGPDWLNRAAAAVLVAAIVGWLAVVVVGIVFFGSRDAARAVGRKRRR